MGKYKTVILDGDNTLLRTDNQLVFYRMMQRYNLDPSYYFEYQNFFKLFSKLTTGIITRDLACTFAYQNISFIRERNINPYEFLDYVDSFVIEAGEVEGARKLLKYLKSIGCINVCLTDWFYKGQMNRLKALHHLEYIDKIYAVDNNYRKPDPRAIQPVFEDYSKEGCVIVGDNLKTDIECANKVKIPSIWLNENGLPIPEDNKPTYMVKQIYDARKYIK